MYYLFKLFLKSSFWILSFQHKFRHWDIRDGREVGARFGLSLAKLGDLDRDGYDDLATGAPYSGPNKEGSIYIFRGGPNGIDEFPRKSRYSFRFYALDYVLSLNANQYP